MLFFLFFLFSLFNQLIFADDVKANYTLIKDLGKEEIDTPSLQKREVLKIRLKNDLEAILVSDPLSAESGAALVVKTGSFEDGEETPGIAHFLEHMLFLGTKKYPEESGYQQFIGKNGGLTNAFTTNDFTGYLFAVNHVAFKEALDRFSEFFKEPLFNPSGVARELQAIDQEYAKNIEDDQIRELYVMKEMVNKKHPYSQFGMGNKNSLSKVSRNELMDWYQKHYSANQMRLIVYSNLPLDELKDLVIEDFGTILNNQRKPMEKASVEIQSEKKDQIVYIEPIKNLKNITLIWYLPEKFANVLDEQPGTLVADLLGDEGQGSLLAHLKSQGLAETLSAGSFKVGPGLQVFYLDLDLTDEGIKSLNQVIGEIFQAIAFLKETAIPKYIFDDYNNAAKLKIKMQQREDLFQKLMKDAMILGTEKIETIPLQTLTIQKFNPELIKELINFLTPSHAEIYVLASKEITGILPKETEKWLHVKYSVLPISKETLETWKNQKPSKELKLPPPNKFIPQNLTLLNKWQKTEEDSLFVPKPKLLIDDEKGKIYFAPDTFFGIPKIYIYYEIKTPEIKSGVATSVVVADLYIKFLKNQLNHLTYEANKAGLYYDIERTDNGIGIKVTGFNENAPLLFKEIVKELNNIEVSEEKFAIFKESLLKDYQNSSKSSPLKIAFDLMKSALYKHYSNEHEKAEAIKKVNLETFQTRLPSIFKQTYVEGMIFGNSLEKEAKEVSQTLLNALSSKPYLKINQKKKEVLVLPSNKGPFYIEKKIDLLGNGLLLVIESDSFSLKKRAAQEVLMNAISTPFFATLRTKQQTGYLVQSSDQDLERNLFNLFMIQSNTHETEALLSRVELFLEGFLQEINTYVTKENFETIKTALIDNLINNYQSSEKMGELLKNLAFKYEGDFDWVNKRILALKELQYQETLDLAKEFIGKTNKRRLALMIKGIIPEENRLNFIKLQTLKELRRLSSYSSG